MSPHRALSSIFNKLKILHCLICSFVNVALWFFWLVPLARQRKRPRPHPKKPKTKQQQQQIVLKTLVTACPWNLYLLDNIVNISFPPCRWRRTLACLLALSSASLLICKAIHHQVCLVTNFTQLQKCHNQILYFVYIVGWVWVTLYSSRGSRKKKKLTEEINIK